MKHKSSGVTRNALFDIMNQMGDDPTNNLARFMSLLYVMPLSIPED